MLASVRKLSQKDSFVVFDDSQLDEPGSTAAEKRDIEIQTNLAFGDANETTELSLPVKDDESPLEDPEIAFWKAAAAVSKEKLDRRRMENERMEAEIAANKTKMKELKEEYEKKFEELAGFLEESA